jgi:hypothetical protein
MVHCGMLDPCKLIFGIVIDLFRPRAALEAEILGKRAIGFWATCPFRKSYPDILVVHPAQYGKGDDAARSLDCPT